MNQRTETRRGAKTPSRVEATRRRFLQGLAMVAVGGQTLLRSGDARAALDAAQRLAGSETPWPRMEYRALGQTGWNASRLVFGCGAALRSRRRDALLDAAFAAGINVFDVGFRGYYKNAEANLAPFLKKHRDEVFLISKAIPLREVEPGDALGATRRREAAANWSAALDASLRELKVDRVDAYYVMAGNNVELVGSDEMLSAFESARQAGKVKYLGVSTHQNAAAVLRTAADTGVYRLAMIAITPGGWYDWKERAILEGTKPLAELQDELDYAKDAGVALVGMKAGRYLAGRRYLGRAKPEAFDSYYDPELLETSLSAFQRSYAYVLAHGLDVVNADMQSLTHLRENVVAATQPGALFASRS